jgi:hypothetical protein
MQMLGLWATHKYIPAESIDAIRKAMTDTHPPPAYTIAPAPPVALLATPALQPSLLPTPAKPVLIHFALLHTAMQSSTQGLLAPSGPSNDAPRWYDLPVSAILPAIDVCTLVDRTRSAPHFACFNQLSAPPYRTVDSKQILPIASDPPSQRVLDAIDVSFCVFLSFFLWLSTANRSF